MVGVRVLSESGAPDPRGSGSGRRTAVLGVCTALVAGFLLIAQPAASAPIGEADHVPDTGSTEGESGTPVRGDVGAAAKATADPTPVAENPAAETEEPIEGGGKPASSSDDVTEPEIGEAESTAPDQDSAVEEERAADEDKKDDGTLF